MRPRALRSAGPLIAARALQGVGVGGLQALSQTAIAAMIPPLERGRYSGYLSSATALSTIGGTTALAILGSLAAGTAMYGAAIFLTQYFQLGRGYSPSAAAC